MGDARRGFDRRVRLEFRGGQLSSDAGLLVMRERDDALGLSGLGSSALRVGSVDLNRFRAFRKWFSALVTPLPL